MTAIRVRARSEAGFRRCGVRHTAEPRVFPSGYFTDEELEQLLDDPNLEAELLDERLEPIDDEDDDQGDPSGQDSEPALALVQDQAPSVREVEAVQEAAMLRAGRDAAAMYDTVADIVCERSSEPGSDATTSGDSRTEVPVGNEGDATRDLVQDQQASQGGEANTGATDPSGEGEGQQSASTSGADATQQSTARRGRGRGGR